MEEGRYERSAGCARAALFRLFALRTRTAPARGAV